MKKKDILSRLNAEIDNVMPKTMNENITKTPIDKVAGASANTNTVAPKKSFVKTRLFQGICASLVCICVLVGILVPVLVSKNGGGGEIAVPGEGTFEGSTYLSVDINPSIDYVVDNKNIVKNVISRNNDGDILLSNGFKDKLIGDSVENAVTKTLAQATKLGYINATAMATDPKVNAVRISVASDKSKSAASVLGSVKASAEEHLKKNGIYMVVVGKEVDKSTILGNSGIDSIDKWNEASETRKSYHYVNNVIGMNKEEMAEEFKREFVSEYISDAFEEFFEDIEDIVSLIGDVEELEIELEEIENEESLLGINKGYWHYRKQIQQGQEADIPEAILDKVNEISEKINEYNELIIESDDVKNIIDISSVFKIIDDNAVYNDWVKLKAMYDLYIKSNLKEDIFNLIDKVEDDIDNLDLLLDKVNLLFSKIFDDFNKVTDKIKATIEEKIAGVSNQAEEYFKICNREINKAYDKLVQKNINNKGNAEISDADYEKFVDDILDKYDDVDDFWDKIHLAK